MKPPEWFQKFMCNNRASSRKISMPHIGADALFPGLLHRISSYPGGIEDYRVIMAVYRVTGSDVPG